MKIQVCTDETVHAALHAAVGPVFVLWEELDSLGYRHNRTVCEFVAEEFDDRIIFMSCLIDENPVAAWALGVVQISPLERKPIPAAVGYYCGRVVDHLRGLLNIDQVREFCQDLADKHAPKLHPPTEGFSGE